MQSIITIRDSWERAFEGPARATVEASLPAFLTASRWFGGKAKTIRSTTFTDVLRADLREVPMVLGFVEVSYADGGVETYTVPMTATFEAEADRIKRDHPNAIIGALNMIDSRGDHAGILYDALWNEDCAYSLLAGMGRRAQFHGSHGTLIGSTTGLFDEIAIPADMSPATVMKAEQSNTSVKFGDRVIMKLYRRIEAGVNPELEIGRVLTARNFRHSPSLVGALEYTREGDEPTTLALAQTFIANQGTAWEYTLSELSRYFDRVASLEQSASRPPVAGRPDSPSTPSDCFFPYLDAADLLGRRTGELHLMLGQASGNPLFAPEPCSPSYVQSHIHAMQCSAAHALTLLRSRLSAHSETDQQQANMVLEQEPVIMDRLGALERMPLTAMRIRCHGDYHLGQILYTGQDFAIIDYEGEPARSLAERRTKHIPIVDVAGMIRSFHYAAHAALRQRNDYRSSQSTKAAFLSWTEQWYQSARAAFLRRYHAVAGKAPFSPRSQHEFSLLLNVHLLDKALYELSYELNNRPEWIVLPLAGILQCVNSSTAGGHQDIWADSEADSRSRCERTARDEVKQ